VAAVVSSAKLVLRWSILANFAIILFATIRGLLKTGNPSRYFGEGRFTTGVSCLQLLIIAFLAFQTFRHRRAAARATRDAGPWLWFLIGAGFVFLSADDALQIHERLDGLIHKSLAMQQTGLTDRIDDAIIALYLIGGLSVLWLFRKEMALFRAMLPTLAAGVAVAVGSIAFDTLSNKPDIISWFVADIASVKKIEGWLAVGDGACELLAEGCFIAAFYIAWRTSETRNR
jgi:hypothetical protein